MSFDDRQRAFEKKYELDEEQRFKIQARRARLLGRWAAEKMGMTADAAETYAREAVAADQERPGIEDLVGKLSRDFEEKGLKIPREDILAEAEILLEAARAQIMDQ